MSFLVSPQSLWTLFKIDPLYIGAAQFGRLVEFVEMNDPSEVPEIVTTACRRLVTDRREAGELLEFIRGLTVEQRAEPAVLSAYTDAWEVANFPHLVDEKVRH